MKRFFITAKIETSLQELLTTHLPSQYNAEKVITSGGVWKDKKRITNPDYIVRPQETIKVHISSFQGKTYTIKEEQVIFENRDLLVVYKPCDLNVHAVPTSIQYNLAYGVNRYLQQQGTGFETTPVTRLDRPVEGLVIFSKNKSYERELFKLMKKRKIKKWYMAALEKRKSLKRLRIRDKISNNGIRTIPDPNGKTADSLFIKTQSLEHADIYSVFIFTGRRHQVRFHASHYIAPIIGDTFYGSAVSLPPDEIALVCRGYNIPYRNQTLKIRLPQQYLEKFYKKIMRNDEL